ncbi:hypothetical protein [Ruminococcus sp.]|uniref:hypothetical protein n=1 Tax=Ruminococcus sp. TaxID=41978 RepID=UPI0025E37576|nr:hypothetical protein [Ruminococcus sp.]MBQ8965406.1 hypothetical protein [Ruminococcus sp.]
MSDMQLLGYYIVYPEPKPEYCTLAASHILTVSEYEFDGKFPDLTKCWFTNYPKSEREAYAARLGLDEKEFSEFCFLVNELIAQKRMSVDTRFGSLEDARKMLSFARNISGCMIVGIYTRSDIAAEFGSEFFEEVPVAESEEEGFFMGHEILGCENMNGEFQFCSYLVNGLEKDISEKYELKPAPDTGFLQNSFDEVLSFADLILGKGEPVVWTPFEIRKFES